MTLVRALVAVGGVAAVVVGSGVGDEDTAGAGALSSTHGVRSSPDGDRSSGEPVSIPRVEPRGPAPVPMPEVRLRGPAPVPMPEVRIDGDLLAPLPDLERGGTK
ncbi:MAG TPA: hypothetical protein VLA97_17570 [Nocardioidaceae bacterium]|nr:hypothetical protein [Nocardioidaceae bacterium]